MWQYLSKAQLLIVGRWNSLSFLEIFSELYSLSFLEIFSELLIDIHMLNSYTKFVCNQNSYMNDINIV